MKALLMIMLLAAAAKPDHGFEKAILILSGASCMEDLDESTLERYRTLAAHPVDLNAAGRSRLLSCGLFNAFQVASLLEYRQNTGDVLSYTELSLVDGFPSETVEALRLFTVLETSGPPGKRHGSRVHNDLMLRASARSGSPAAGGFKYKLSAGERAELGWGSRITYSDRTLRPGTVSAALYGRRHLGKLVLGHFNARFGQGLALWSGFSVSPYSSVSSLVRSGTGISTTASFDPQFCGAAADFDFGRWNAGCGYSVKGNMPFATVSYTSRTFTAGALATNDAASAFWRAGFPNLSFFGELAWKGGAAASCGLLWVPSYGRKAAVLCRYVEGAAEALAGIGTASLDAVAAISRSQQRVTVKWSPRIGKESLTLTPSLRFAARRTDVLRLEGRGELQLDAGAWMVRSRLDVVHCSSYSWLFNAEAGHTQGALRAWLRWTLFRVEDWPDRIYVYERDAPGNFNVPAYYGKGWSISAYGAWKPSRRHALYLRLSYIAYPWNLTEKPERAEVKLQYQLSL